MTMITAAIASSTRTALPRSQPAISETSLTRSQKWSRKSPNRDVFPCTRATSPSSRSATPPIAISAMASRNCRRYSIAAPPRLMASASSVIAFGESGMRRAGASNQRWKRSRHGFIAAIVGALPTAPRCASINVSRRGPLHAPQTRGLSGRYVLRADRFVQPDGAFLAGPSHRSLEGSEGRRAVVRVRAGRESGRHDPDREVHRHADAAVPAGRAGVSLDLEQRRPHRARALRRRLRRLLDPSLAAHLRANVADARLASLDRAHV